MTVAYNIATDLLTISAGTAEAPETFATAIAYVEANIDLLLLAEQPNAAEMSLAYQPKPAKGMCKLKVTVTGTVVDGVDYINIEGDDLWGVGVSARINPGAAGGTYYTGTRFATVDANGVTCNDSEATGWTIEIEQYDEIGLITRAADSGPLASQITVNCNIQFGIDTGEQSYFASVGEQVTFVAGKTFTLANKVNVRLGARYPTTGTEYWGRSGSYWTVAPSANMAITASAKPDAVFELYSSTFRLTTNPIPYMNTGTCLARNSLFLCDSANGELQFAADVSIDWKRVQLAGWLYVRLNGCTMTAFEDVHSHGGYSGVRATGTSVTLDRLRITGVTYAPTTIHAYNCTLSLKDRILEPGKEALSTANIYLQTGTDSQVHEVYRCNIHVVDAAGANLGGVTVTCKKADTSTAFSVETAETGKIAEQTITYKRWYLVDTTETEEAFGPFTFVLSKAGYETLTLENVTVDRPIVWRLEMSVPSSGGVGVRSIRSGGAL